MARSERSTVLTLRVPRDLDHRIEQEALRTRRSKSAVLREALQTAFALRRRQEVAVKRGRPITPDCVDAPLFRLTLPPGARTGLEKLCQPRSACLTRPRSRRSIRVCSAGSSWI